MRTKQRFVDSLHKVLAQHYKKRRFTIAQMAAGMGISERQLQRKVNELTGYTPAQYLCAYRLRTSLDLLRLGEEVGSVARAVGFSSHAYFTSCFKAKFGTTPSRFRQGCR